jgi:hypothetical protein
MQPSEEKEVWYNVYCEDCTHYEEDPSDVDSKCYDCLAEPVNSYSHKPVYFEGKK